MNTGVPASSKFKHWFPWTFLEDFPLIISQGTVTLIQARDDSSWTNKIIAERDTKNRLGSSSGDEMNMAISKNMNGWGTREREEIMTMPRFLASM